MQAIGLVVGCRAAFGVLQYEKMSAVLRPVRLHGRLPLFCPMLRSPVLLVTFFHGCYFRAVCEPGCPKLGPGASEPPQAPAHADGLDDASTFSLRWP